MAHDLRPRVYFTHDNGGRPFRVTVTPHVDGPGATVEVEYNELYAERHRQRRQPGWTRPPRSVQCVTVADLLAAAAQAPTDAGGDDAEEDHPGPAVPAGIDVNWPGTREAAAAADADGCAQNAAATEAAAQVADADRAAGLTDAAVAAGWWKSPPGGPVVVLEAAQVFVGRSRAGWPGVASRNPAEDARHAGNTLLVRLADGDDGGGGIPYALVAGTAVSKLVLPEAVTAYYSPVGNSDVPYPVAVTPGAVVELTTFHRLPRAVFGPGHTVGDLLAGGPVWDRVLPVANWFTAPSSDTDNSD